jgi:parallel beta-helix repeat protein
VRGSTRTLLGAVLALALAALTPVTANAAPSYPPCWHTPILIHGDAAFTSANGVTAGSGTAADPYVIGGWCISAATSTGILIRDTTAHFEVRNVLVHSGGQGFGSSTGVFLWNADHGLVTASTITANYDGIFVRDSQDVAIVGNDITENENDGIFLLSSAAVTIQSNIVWKNKARGVGLHDSEDVAITENGISWNGHDTHSDGLLVSHSDHVTITENNILYNGGAAPPPGPSETIDLPAEPEGYGVNLTFATDVHVHHNNLIGNHAQAREAGTLNFWDDGYPNGGNFWSNYAGPDQCSGSAQNVCPNPDGIGDLPVPLRLDTNRDHYPLMDPVPGMIFISGNVLTALASGWGGADRELESLAARLADAIARLTDLAERDREALRDLHDTAEGIVRRLEDYRASAPPLPKWPRPVEPTGASGPLHALAADLEAIDTQIARVLLELLDPSRLERSMLDGLDAMLVAARSIVEQAERGAVR